MYPIDRKLFDEAMAKCGILDLANATIRQIGALAAALETIAGEESVHLEMGNPGLPAVPIGVEAEHAALDKGVAGIYPNIAGIPQLKNAAEKFIKAFLDIEMPARCIIPTVGSMQGSFTLLLLLGQRLPGRDTVLYLDPGFPAQRNQAKVLGLQTRSFDIYNCRGAALEGPLREAVADGRVTALIYSNPNNPAWTNLTEQELEIIGRVCEENDVVVVEDLAYFGMDFRTDFSHPGEPPYPPTVARYTKNYIMLMSASKIFSYAGQRIALACISPEVFDRKYPFFEEFYEMPKFGDAYIFGVLYCASSGTSHTAQYAMAAMLDASAEGRLDFVGDCRDYERRAALARKAFTDAGFHLVYDRDGDVPVSDGFFFTMGYGDMDSVTLQREMLRYGIAAISLPSTGSRQHGLRICVSMLTKPELFDTLSTRLKQFANAHPQQN